ncbi:hypothetical protein K9O81_18915 [Leclercia adecarboxylata]|uniref:hypothetical protein n=2 Tax=Leclercia adecarboxylata TaxID=83655 RepID=UPI001CBB92C6|nr:hypothetical protein [Leclercia adecarboxylata]MBZ3802443.1 hypothetical protein [Leclercia adecarboxylata]MBZ3807079.1 hypothetical protein [Leclercia adecarboxylata]
MNYSELTTNLPRGWMAAPAHPTIGMTNAGVAAAGVKHHEMRAAWYEMVALTPDYNGMPDGVVVAVGRPPVSVLVEACKAADVPFNVMRRALKAMLAVAQSEGVTL